MNSCWWKHHLSSVLDTTNCKILWDFSIITDRPIIHNRPDIVVIDKQTSTCYFIDVAIPGDARVKLKITEKLTVSYTTVVEHISYCGSYNHWHIGLCST